MKHFLLEKVSLRSVIKIQQLLKIKSDYFKMIVVELGDICKGRCTLGHDDFTDAVKSFSLSGFINKKLNNDNYNKCIIYKSPIFVHRIYTYKHYSTFIRKTKIRYKNVN